MESVPISNVLCFLEAREARQLAKTCKAMRNAVERHKFHVHFVNVYDVAHPEWGTEYINFCVMTKPEALKKAAELKNDPKAHQVYIWKNSFEPLLGQWEPMSTTVFEWERVLPVDKTDVHANGSAQA